MAFLYITETSGVANVNNATFAQDAPAMPPLGEKVLAITTTSTASTTFSAQTKLILVSTDAICSLAFSTSSTTVSATTSAHRMPANTTRLYGVTPGGTISVVSNT